MEAPSSVTGTAGAKREWTEHGMTAAVGKGLSDFKGFACVVVGELDRVERPEALRTAFASALPQAIVETVPEVGHLLPIESPGVIVAACRAVASRRNE